MNRAIPESDVNLIRLSEMVAVETGLTQEDAQAVLQSTLDVMGRTLAAGYRIKLTNFGSFSLGSRHVSASALGGKAGPARQVRVVRFRATGRLLEAVREGRAVTTLKKLAPRR